MDENQKEIKNDVPDSDINIRERSQNTAQEDNTGMNQEDRPLTYGDDSKMYAKQQNRYAGLNPQYGQGQQNPPQGSYLNPGNQYAGTQNQYTQQGPQNPVQGQNAGVESYTGQQGQYSPQQNQYTNPQGQYSPQQQGQYQGQQNQNSDQQGQYSPQQNQYTNPQGQFDAQQNQYANPQGQFNAQQNRYTQPAPGYGQPFNGYGNAQPAHGPVKDIFCYFVLVLLPLRNILGFFMVNMTYDNMAYKNMMDRGYMVRALDGPYQLLSLLSTALMIAYIAFVALDISKIYKENYKITGLILFAIFLTSGYYIWRAYILGRKKTVPVIYTIFISILLLVYFVFIMYGAFSLVINTMTYM